ncbi:MAG: alpha-E domain-containing protein [Bacteroidales bacterium]
MTKLQELEISTLSKEKAIRLLWLGRYTERAYFSLHVLRKYHDKMIDEDDTAYKTYCLKMGVDDKYKSATDFMVSYLYDKTNPDSLISMLSSANDNAIVLREEITSETLSYIQLCISHLNACASENLVISELQYVTDHLLAFWGSIDVRIGNSTMRNVLKAGRLIESVDLHIRFDYSFERVNQLFLPLSELVIKEKYIFNDDILEKLTAQMSKINYREVKTLQLVNQLFNA